jgi:hypothetical protein
MTVYKLESVPDPLFEQNPVLYNALWNARNVEVKVPEVPGIHINMDTRTITVTGDLPTEDQYLWWKNLGENNVHDC